MGKEELIQKWREERRIKDKKIIEAFRKVKRENFVKPEYLEDSYDDIPLPIGHGATISQPTTVVIMLGALELKKGDKVLEVGSGSGYVAALISEIVKPGKVIATEIIEELVEFSKRNLKRGGIKNVKIICYDGSKGYEKEAPYDKIIVSAASRKIPKELIKQLKNDGIMLIPVGPGYEQRMLKIMKKGKEIKVEYLGEFLFVPLQTEE